MRSSTSTVTKDGTLFTITVTARQIKTRYWQWRVLWAATMLGVGLSLLLNPTLGHEVRSALIGVLDLYVALDVAKEAYRVHQDNRLLAAAKAAQPTTAEVPNAG